MSRNFIQSEVVRDASIGLFRIYAQAQFWRKGPRIFVNSLPKAGTHLLMSMLDAVPGIMNSRLHIRTWSVLFRTPHGLVLDVPMLTGQLSTIRGGQVASIHLPYVHSVPSVVQEQGFGMINLTRSPRDALISHYFYVAGLRRHRLHEHLTTHYPGKKAMLLALIEGPKPGEDTVGGQFRPFADILRDYAGWTTAPGVLSVSYEDLVGQRGGGSDERQLLALSNISRHLQLPIAAERFQSIWRGIEDRKTATFRKGRIGDWVNHFDSDIAEAFDRSIERSAATAPGSPADSNASHPTIGATA